MVRGKNPNAAPTKLNRLDIEFGDLNTICDNSYNMNRVMSNIDGRNIQTELHLNREEGVDIF